MRVAILPGDGIGPEIIAQAKKVLRKLGLPLETQDAPVGGAGYEAAGNPLPPPTLQLAKNADAILLARWATRATTSLSARSARSRRSSAYARSSACSPICVQRRS